MAQKAPNFELLPATKADIPRLAQIHVAACMTDDALKLYFESEDEFANRVSSMLEDQIGEPTWHHVKAVDKATRRTASWASWNIPTDDEIRDRDRGTQNKKMALQKENHDIESCESEKDTGSNQPVPHRKGEFDFPGGLASHVKQQATRWLNSLTFNRRHIQARALFTDPEFEKRGMATALIECGNDLADQAALPCCLLATTGAEKLYVRHGWLVMQHHDVDLREWTPRDYHSGGGEEHDYRFRYMLRLPEIPSK